MRPILVYCHLVSVRSGMDMASGSALSWKPDRRYTGADSEGVCFMCSMLLEENLRRGDVVRLTCKKGLEGFFICCSQECLMLGSRGVDLGKLYFSVYNAPFGGAWAGCHTGMCREDEGKGLLSSMWLPVCAVGVVGVPGWDEASKCDPCGLPGTLSGGTPGAMPCMWLA